MNSFLYIKKLTILLGISIVVALAIIITTGCSKDDEEDKTPTTETTQLTQDEKAMLVQMREEEKLARDVYTVLYNKYDRMVFTNISSSEQSHMDKVLELLTKYEIEDPSPLEAGKYTSPELQTLYNDLVAKGNISISEALLVGATIEDLDIYDLEEFMMKTDKTDILDAFDFLNCGSRNHMRAFISNLTQESTSYTPVYITYEHFDNIINSPKEKCNN